MISEGLKSNSTLTELYLCGYGKKKEVEGIIKKKKKRKMENNDE